MKCRCYILFFTVISAFYLVNNATAATIQLPAGIRNIEDETFYGDTSLDEVILPEGVEHIGARAFYGSSVKRIYLPRSLKSINPSAFEGCTTVGYGEDNTRASDFFKNTEGLSFEVNRVETPKEHFRFNQYGHLISYIGPEEVKEIVIPDTTQDGIPVTVILKGAITNSYVESIHIPDSVSGMYSESFVCSNCTHINFPRSWRTVWGTYYVGIPNGYMYSPFSCPVREMMVPEGAEEIPNYAFQTHSLDDIYIPASVTSIGYYAFGYLRDMTIHGVPGSYAETYANEKGCTFIPDYPARGFSFEVRNEKECIVSGYNGSETDITVPSVWTDKNGEKYDVTGIGAYAFSNCSLIHRITLPESIKSLSVRSFAYCDSLNSIFIPPNVRFIASGAFEGHNSNLVIYGESGSCAESWATENHIPFIAGNTPEDSDRTAITGTVMTAAGEPVPDVFVCAANVDNSADSVWVMSDADGRWRLDLLPGQAYTINFICFGYEIPEQAVTVTAGMTIASEAAPVEKPDIEFTMTPAEITVGDTVDFTVHAPGASRVKLLFDGHNYDGDIYELDAEGKIAFSRRVTRFVEKRTVSFVAEIDGEWTEPCESQELTMSSMDCLGDLYPVEIESLPDPHRKGSNLQVVWKGVENADEYIVYLYSNTGDSTDVFREITDLGDGRFAVIIPAEYLTEEYYTVLVMACGAGYSQSETGAYLWVREPYEEQIGWPQAEMVPTYISLNPLTRKGHVDNTESVLVLDEIGDFFYIEMHLTAGGYVRRFVHKNMILIGDEESCKWMPPLKISASCVREEDGSVTVLISTNQTCVKAGIMLDDTIVASSSEKPALDVNYIRKYTFTFVPEDGITEYSAYVSDGSNIKKTSFCIPRGSSGSLPGIPSDLYLEFSYETIPLGGSNLRYGQGKLQKGNTLSSKELNYKTKGQCDICLFSADKDPVTSRKIYSFIDIQSPDENGKVVFCAQLDHSGLRSGESGFLTPREGVFLVVPSIFAEKLPDGRYAIDGETVAGLQEYSSQNGRYLIDERTLYYIDNYEGPRNINARINYCIDFPWTYIDFEPTVQNNYNLDDLYIAKVCWNGKNYYCCKHCYDKDNNSYADFYFDEEEMNRINAGLISLREYELEAGYLSGGGMFVQVKNDRPLSSNPAYLVARYKTGSNGEYTYAVSELKTIREGNPFLLKESFSALFGFEPVPGMQYGFSVVNASDQSIFEEAEFYYSFYYSGSISLKSYTDTLKAGYKNHRNPLADVSIEGRTVSFSADDVVGRYLYDRLVSFGISAEYVCEMMAMLKDAYNRSPDEVYLYLFSVPEYSIEIHADEKCSRFKKNYNKIEEHFFPTSDKIQLVDATYNTGSSICDFLTTMFHESGHAADYNSGGFGNQTGKGTIKSTLTDNMKNDLRLFLGACLNNYCSEKAVTLTDDQKKNILNAILDSKKIPEYSGLSSNELRIYIRDALKIVCDPSSKYNEQGNACMVDAALGLMKNMSLDDSDVKVLIHHERSYWQEDENRYAYEAYAEYFACRITGYYMQANKDFFPKTYDFFCGLTRSLLNYYQ